MLTDAGSVYAATFGYPERQLIGLNKLTRVPSTAGTVESAGDDLVFVSNAIVVTASEDDNARLWRLDDTALPPKGPPLRAWLESRTNVEVHTAPRQQR